jgi:hypothetical protein
MKVLKIFLFLASVLLATQLVYSQEAFPVSGGEATGFGGSGSYTVGQVFYTSHTATTGVVSQGVQHPFELQTLSNPALTTVNLSVFPYPNPTKDFIVLEITDKGMNDLRYTLFDVNGRAIVSKAITASSTQIQMKYLAVGTYILKVIQKNKALKSFKILKQQ